MKKLQLIALLLIASYASQATVRTVNIAGGAQFTTIEAAVVASSSVAGDTIYISGSASTYASPTTKKSNLTFIGSGFNVTKQNPLKTMITNSFTCTDSCKLIGIDISNGLISTNVSVSGLRVSRCRLGGNFSATTITNCMIDNCLYVFTVNTLFSNATLNNVAVNNCILYTNTAVPIFSSVSFAGGGLTFDHCNFINSSTSIQLMSTGNVSGVSFTNSVFFNFNPIPATTTFTYLNNYASVALNGFSNSSGNIVGSTSPFVTATITGAFAYTQDFHLAAASPLIGAGLLSTDIGAYGGVTPYQTDGEPAIPQIPSMNLIGNQFAPGGTMNIQFQSTIHN